MLAYVDANVSWPEWGCLAFTPEMRTNLILLQYQHQLTCSHFYSHLLMKLRACLWVRSTNLSSVSQIFVNDVYQLLMEPGHLTTIRKSLLMYTIGVLPKHCWKLESPEIFKKYYCLALTLSQCNFIAMRCKLGSGIFKYSPGSLIM